MAFVAKLEAKPIDRKNSTLIPVKVELSRFLYKDEDSGYFVIAVELVKHEAIPKDPVVMNSGVSMCLESRQFIAVGTSEYLTTSVVEGQELEIWGRLVEGREKNTIQMEVTNIIELMPTHPDSIRAFLSSNKIKGIGPKGAAKAVEKFGPKTLQILKENPEKFQKDLKISDENFTKLKESWARWELSFDALSRLRMLKIPNDVALKIYNHFGEECDKIIQRDPYKAVEVRGIGFQTADEIAINLGVSATDESRVKSGVQYVIQDETSNGNTYINSLHLRDRAIDTLKVEFKEIVKALKALIVENRIMQGTLSHKILADKRTNRYEDIKVQAFADVKLFKAEFLVAKELFRITQQASRVEQPLFTQEDIDEYFDFNKDKLDQSQLNAAKVVLSKKVSVLTGGPGTGKTHTIKALLNFFDFINQRKRANNLKGDISVSIDYALAAPTGRAAKRMNESTGRPSSTIHSMLQLTPGMNPGAEGNEGGKLSSDVFIIDESSMLDIWIAASLLRAVPDGAMVIFVGDVDQLRSVGPGKVFLDIINSGYFPVARLQEIHRQAKHSNIIVSAHSVIHNKMPKLYREGEDSDTIFIPAYSSPDIQKAIVDKVTQLLAQGVNPKDIQILTPKRVGEIGVKGLNEVLRPILNKKYRLQSYLDSKFVSGDRVMQLKNRKDLDIYNGDIGEVKYFDEGNNNLVVTFDKKDVVLDNKDWKHLDFAYASTIHKAQGSDYPYVIMPIAPADVRMWDCNLLYTGITRAKHFLFMVGDERTMSLAVAAFKKVERLTGLREALNERFELGEELDFIIQEKYANQDMEDLDMSEEMEDAVY